MFKLDGIDGMLPGDAPVALICSPLKFADLKIRRFPESI